MLKDRQYKCPVCGAPVDGYKCEYCGCVIYDFAMISTDKPCYIRMRMPDVIDGKNYIFQIKAVAVNPIVEVKMEETHAVDLAGTNVERFVKNQTCTMSVDFQAVVDDNGALFTLIDAERPYRESWRDDVEAG